MLIASRDNGYPLWSSTSLSILFDVAWGLGEMVDEVLPTGLAELNRCGDSWFESTGPKAASEYEAKGLPSG